MDTYEEHELTQEIIDFVTVEDSDDLCARFVSARLGIAEHVAWEVIDYIWVTYGREE